MLNYTPNTSLGTLGGKLHTQYVTQDTGRLPQLRVILSFKRIKLKTCHQEKFLPLPLSREVDTDRAYPVGME